MQQKEKGTSKKEHLGKLNEMKGSTFFHGEKKNRQL